MFKDVSKKEQQAIVDKLTYGMKEKSTPNSLANKSRVYETEGGTKVTIRTQSSSNDGNLNIDIDKKVNGKRNKIEIKFK